MFDDSAGFSADSTSLIELLVRIIALAPVAGVHHVKICRQREVTDRGHSAALVHPRFSVQSVFVSRQPKM